MYAGWEFILTLDKSRTKKKKEWSWRRLEKEKNMGRKAKREQKLTLSRQFFFFPVSFVREDKFDCVSGRCNNQTFLAQCKQEEDARYMMLIIASRGVIIVR